MFFRNVYIHCRNMRCHNTKYSSKCDCCLQYNSAAVNWCRLFLGTPRSSPAIQFHCLLHYGHAGGSAPPPTRGLRVVCVYWSVVLHHNSRPETIDPSGVWKERTKGSAVADTCRVWEIAGCSLARKIGCHVRRILGWYFRDGPRPFSSSGVLCIVHDNPFSVLNAK